jgi:tetratricopeptide (TPR) repeat protein
VGRFANISAVSGLDMPDDGRAVAQVDWDHDGDQDLWISNRNAPRLRLLRNDVPGKGHFLAVRLAASGTTTNRDALGARVEVVLAGSVDPPGRRVTRPPKLVKTLRGGEGFLAQSSKWLHFGLGDAAEIENVIVRWPSTDARGQFEQFGAMKVDRRYELVEGTGIARDVPSQGRSLALEPSIPQLPPPIGNVRLPLMVRLLVPNVAYETFEGHSRRLPLGAGNPVLVNLWSSTCHPCLVELSELAKRAGDLRAAGIEIVALCVDGLSNSSSNPQSARNLLARLDFPFPAGRAPRDLIAGFQRLQDYQTPVARQLPVPTSFLIDQQDCLAVIYKGQVSVDQLVEDAKARADSPADRFERSAALPGRAIRHAVARQSLTGREMKIRLRLANDLQQANRLDESVAQYREVLELDPRLANAHNNLGLVYRQQGNLNQAKASYERGLDINSDSAEMHNNLGVVLFKLGDVAQAKNHYQRALRINSDYVEAEMNLGMLWEKQGEFSQAASHFARALRINPKFSDAELHLGILLERQGKLAEAASHYEDALRINSENVDAHNNLGVVWAKLGDLPKAVTHFESALRIAPELAEAHNNLGVLLENQGHLDRAKDHYETALRINPGYAEAQRNLKHVQGLLKSKESPIGQTPRSTSPRRPD